MKTEPRPQITAQKLVKKGRLEFQAYSQKETQTNTHMQTNRHAHHNTLPPEQSSKQRTWQTMQCVVLCCRCVVLCSRSSAADWSQSLIHSAQMPPSAAASDRRSSNDNKAKKLAHTRLLNVGFRSWPQFLAVSLQVTWVINPPVNCHYFPSGLQLPSQPLRKLLPILLHGEQKHDGHEQFA